MAPNTSSLYNKPAAADAPADNAVMVSKTPAAAPSDATSAASVSPSTTTMTSSSSVSTASPSSPDDVCLGTSAPRFSPSVLDSVKASLAGRKSCLKRPMPPSPRPAAALATPKKAEEPARPVQKNRRRCWECRAKVGLAAVTCRCEYTFCNKHRYAEEHHCSFNFKTAGKRKLAEDNPRVVPAKVARIN